MGLASSQRPPGDIGQARGGEGVLVFVFLAQQPESLLSQKWPLSGSWGLGMKKRGAQVLQGIGNDQF